MIVWIFCLVFSGLSFIEPGNSENDYYSYTLDNFRNVEAFNETVDISSADYPRLNAVIFYLTNEARNKKKLPLLQYEVKLEESATLHCNSMVEYSFFDHINPKSKEMRNPNDRARLVGITNPYLAENIMETFVLQYKAGDPVFPGGKGVFRYKEDGDPIQPHTYLSLGEALLKGWLNSTHHKENILSKSAQQLGCGTAFYQNKDFNEMPTVIATQNFQLYETARFDP